MPDFRHRLPRQHQRVYDRSNTIPAIPLRVTPLLAQATVSLAQALAWGQQPAIERLAQAVSSEICAALQVPPVRACACVAHARPAGAASCTASTAPAHSTTKSRYG
ncbi:MAG: hypothetical protein HY699_21320 [Deltaproteobacteria bacterium]|nr:hypothetical protein [Deltaproteobacteria bacterium]